MLELLGNQSLRRKVMNFKSTTERKKKNTLLCKRQGKLFLFLLILGSTANNKPYIVFCPSAQLFWVKMGGTPKKNKQRKLELRGYNRSESHLFPFRERDSEKTSRAFRHLRKNYGGCLRTARGRQNPQGKAVQHSHRTWCKKFGH